MNNYIQTIDHTEEATLFLNKTGEIIDLNQSAEKLLNKPRHELINKKVIELYSNIKKTGSYPEMLRAFKQRMSTSFEYHSQNHNRRFAIRLSPVDGGVVVYINDITDQKTTLFGKECDYFLLKRIIENIPLGVIVAEAPSGKLIFANHHIEKLFGRSLVQTIYSEYYSDWLGFHENGQPYNLAEWPIYRSINNGEFIEGEEIYYYFKDKTKHLIRFRSNPIKDKTGKIIAAVAVGFDVTETKNYETELFKREQQFKTLAENSPDIIARFDKDLRYIYANPAVEKLLNIPLSKIVGKNNEELGFSDKVIPKYNKKMSKVFETRRTQKIVFSLPIHNTEKYFQSWLVPEFDNNKNIVSGLSISRDISELKKIEKKKDDFLSIASHEIKTPLTSLKGYIQILQLKFSSSEPIIYDYLNKMDSQIDKTVRLINELLEISRIQSGKITLNKKRFSLNNLIKETIENIQPTVKTHKITFETNDNVYVYADKDRICQVLNNLLNNAIRYSPEANKVIVRLKNFKKKANIYVQDFGIGISPKHRSKIFGMFYRISDQNSQASLGLGVGLFVAAQIIKYHKGQIRVNSQENKGSTFCFTLPLSGLGRKNI